MLNVPTNKPYTPLPLQNNIFKIDETTTPACLLHVEWQLRVSKATFTINTTKNDNKDRVHSYPLILWIVGATPVFNEQSDEVKPWSQWHVVPIQRPRLEHWLGQVKIDELTTGSPLTYSIFLGSFASSL